MRQPLRCGLEVVRKLGIQVRRNLFAAVTNFQAVGMVKLIFNIIRVGILITSVAYPWNIDEKTVGEHSLAG